MPINNPKHFLAFSLFAIFFFPLYSWSQTTKDSTKTAKSYFKASATYLTNSVYNGRKDSTVIPYLVPSVTYHNKTGIHVDASLYYQPNAQEDKVNGAEISVGYEFKNKSEKLTGDVYASKYINSISSEAVNAEINAGLGAYAAYDASFINISLGADASFSSKTDINLNFQLSHLFSFGKSLWSFSPSASINAGTQNFYQDYIKNRKVNPRKKKNATTPTPPPVTVSFIKKDFSVLDYEISVPVNFDGKKFGAFFTPVYAIPVNPITLSINNGRMYKTEPLSNSFSAEVGVYVKF